MLTTKIHPIVLVRRARNRSKAKKVTITFDEIDVTLTVNEMSPERRIDFLTSLVISLEAGPTGPCPSDLAAIIGRAKPIDPTKEAVSYRMWTDHGMCYLSLGTFAIDSGVLQQQEIYTMRGQEALVETYLQQLAPDDAWMKTTREEEVYFFVRKKDMDRIPQ